MLGNDSLPNSGLRDACERWIKTQFKIMHRDIKTKTMATAHDLKNVSFWDGCVLPSNFQSIRPLSPGSAITVFRVSHSLSSNDSTPSEASPLCGLDKNKSFSYEPLHNLGDRLKQVYD